VIEVEDAEIALTAVDARMIAKKLVYAFRLRLYLTLP
jgi:hypothetical protein